MVYKQYPGYSAVLESLGRDCRMHGHTHHFRTGDVAWHDIHAELTSITPAFKACTHVRVNRDGIAVWIGLAGPVRYSWSDLGI